MSRTQLPASLPNGKLMTAEERFLHLKKDLHQQLITSMDLVVTVCTTVVHLSGALGKTAWVMVPAVAEWRYLESGSHIPWYPALRLFRQQHRKEWDDVIATVRTELQHRAAIAGASA